LSFKDLGGQHNSNGVQMAGADDLVSKGRRHLACSEIQQAVENFQKACELLAAEFGDLDDRLGVPNLLYGSALLELARMESTVIGNALEGAEEKEELSDQVIDAMCEEEKTVPPEEPTSSEEKPGTEQDVEPTVGDEKEQDNAQDGKETTDTDNVQEEENGEEEKTEDENENEECNEADTDEQEDDVTNLQLAWEVIEVARKIFSRKDDDESRLKVAECYEKLGEISREKEDYTQAVSDLQECLVIRQSLLSDDHREVAETHFQIGTTHAVAGSLESAMSAFEAAISSLEKHAANLRKKINEDEKSHNENELELLKSSLKEVETLIPELETRKSEVEEDLQASKLQPQTSTSFPATAETSCDKKPVDDISHLVRKKRQVTENKIDVNGANPVNGDGTSPITKKPKIDGKPDQQVNGDHAAEAQVGTNDLGSSLNSTQISPQGQDCICF
uniref:TPR_REGION domain-containing protein n=1 Tax=Echinostoma caproni TaxID=27848 RepID=A0A183B4A3_9TREM